MIMRAAQQVPLIAHARVMDRRSAGSRPTLAIARAHVQTKRVLEQREKPAADAAKSARVGGGAGQGSGENRQADGDRIREAHDAALPGYPERGDEHGDGEDQVHRSGVARAGWMQQRQ